METPETSMSESEVPETEVPESEVPVAPVRGHRAGDNTVFVGKKGTMGYVLAVVTQFNNGATEVNVKARGKLISRAVDVVEIVRHRFMPNALIKAINISTEELASEDGSMNKVSSIEIKIQK
jgi:DNA-binding protein